MNSMTLCMCYNVPSDISTHIVEFIKFIEKKMSIASDLNQKFSIFIIYQFRLHNAIKYIKNVIDNTVQKPFVCIFCIFFFKLLTKFFAFDGFQ